MLMDDECGAVGGMLGRGNGIFYLLLHFYNLLKIHEESN
jgi:hypothetical protein